MEKRTESDSEKRNNREILMVESIDRDICTGCCLCHDVCAHQAIHMEEDADGFLRPVVDKAKCVGCGLCVNKCIAENANAVTRHELKEEIPYAAWSLNEELVKKSASGGIFAQLAVDFLDGEIPSIVYGARLKDECTVEHIGIKSKEEITLLQNSKYRHSNTSGIYKSVKQNLKDGCRVLFSGTPCQVAAIYEYVGYHPNLFTAEILCHGVPSNHLAELALRIEDAKRIVSYRTKSLGWAKGNRTVYEDKAGKVYEKDRIVRDFHFRAYLSFSTNRNSCMRCPFAQVRRVADITMGDFWGKDNLKYNNPGGVSVVLVNSAKGEEMMKSSQFFRKPTSWEEITRLNQNIYMPTNYRVYRLQDKLHKLKTKPVWLQKLILQNGFSNRYLNYLWQKLFEFITFPQRIKANKEADQQRKVILNQISAHKKKVGILTTYFAANFGAMLQPYALKRVLENEGCEVEFIRYKQHAVYNSHLPISREKIKNRSIGSICGVISALPLSYLQYYRLQRFRKLYLQKRDDFEESIPQDKDFYFFGSDQIWNPRNTNGFDKIYFGDFSVKEGAKKIAYAASGECISYTEEQCNWLKRNLQRFDSISVREKSLCDSLKIKVGITDVDVVLDPTLLATKDILDELPSDNPMKGKPFVFFYQLRDSVRFLPDIYNFAQRKGLELLIISSAPKKDLIQFAFLNKGTKYIPAAGMDVFLGGMRHADYVFTPSFHGAVFAIINHRPLFAMQLGDGLDTRQHDLLTELCMENRLVNFRDGWENVEATNYFKVDEKLSALREHSMMYIRKSMKL